jgi:type I restriction enzyme R subunit
MIFDEESLESLFMEEFEARGYEHINGETIRREETDIIIADDLKEYLRRRYRKENLLDVEINMVLATFASRDRGIYVDNRDTFKKIRDGFSFRRVDKSKPAIWINLIDFFNLDNNIFKIVNQYTIQGLKQRRRPDAIVFVNGLPLVVIEFKSAVKEDADIHEAWLQINTRYVRDIPDLFKYTAFTMISDGVNSKLGTHFTRYEDYYAWNKAESTDSPSSGLSSIDVVMDGVFRKDRLLAILNDFVYFPDMGTEEKIVCRYPQFFGANALFGNIKKHMKPSGDGKGGTYFGTTGCGKSYTMLFLSRMLMRSKEMGNPTIILITDRNNLDDQLHKQFVVSKEFLCDDNVVSIHDRADLKSKLKGIASGGVFLTTIQKFSEDEDPLSERNNIIVISDEAHRSQLNLEESDRMVNGQKKHIKGFASMLHDAFPNATYVGFTGTPIDDTIEVFGDIVDQYTMVESERDKITSKLVYEGRAAKVTLDPAQMAAIEDYYSDCEAGGSNIFQIEKSKKDLTKMKEIIGNDRRIEKVARDFVGHYEKRVEDGSTVAGKCMFVCASRQIAFKLYCKLKKLRPEWFEIKEGNDPNLSKELRAKPIEMVKMVATRGPNDPKEMFDMLGTDDYKEDLAAQFKKIDSNFKIAIVVDMWLTGFDVKFLDAIYIDKPIQKHSLIQAISRVNRIYPGKEYGLVVDYLGIRKELDAALKMYTNGFKSEGLERSEDFVLVFREYLSIIDGMFHGFDMSGYYSENVKDQFRCLNDGVEFVQGDAELETRFMDAVRKLKTAYNNCTYSESISKEERDRMYFYTAVRSVMFKITKGEAPDTAQMNSKVREMLERAIQSDDVIQIVTTTEEMDETTIDLLSDEYLERIKKIPGLNTKFKLLQKLAKITLSSFKRTNKLKSEEFTDRFNTIVRKYNDRHSRAEDISKMVNEMLEMIIELHTEMESGASMGMSAEEKAFYDILDNIVETYQFEFDKDVMKEMAKRMKEATDKACSVLDWISRADVRAQLQFDIVEVMYEFGFPPEYHDGVYQKVFEQMERYKRYSD